MIKLYGIKTCPECSGLYEQVKGDSRFEIIDVGQHILLLKEFLGLRDTAKEKRRTDNHVNGKGKKSCC
jgi:glutaredoxin-related protein